MPSNTTEHSAVTVKGAADRLAVSESLVWKLIREGRIRAIRLGRRTLIPTSEVARIVTGDEA